METVTLNVNIGDDGRLRLDLPTSLPQGQHRVVVSVRDQPDVDRKIDLSDLAGALQWRGDAVAQQRRLRDAW